MRRSRGFTLAETLIAVMILALVTAAGTAAVTAVLAARNRMIQAANAQVLASSAAQAIADELRFGRGIKVADTEVALDSARFDTGCTLRLSTGDAAEYKTLGDRTVPAGRLVMQRTETVKDAAGVFAEKTLLRELLGEKAYDDLQISRLAFTLPPGSAGTADSAVTVDLTVADEGGHDLWSITFTVVPLNDAGNAPPPAGG